MFCRCLATSGVTVRGGRATEIEVRIGNVRRGNVARSSELSVGSKWRLCVIDTAEFALKMTVFVMYLVVSRPEGYPGSMGRTPRTRHWLTNLSKYVCNHIAPTLCPLHKYLGMARVRLQSR